MNYKILIVVVSNNQKQQKFYFLQNFVFNWFCGFFLWVSLTIFPCLYFHVYFRSLVLSRLNMDQDNTFLNFKQTVEKMCKARVAKPPSSKHLWDLAKGARFLHVSTKQIIEAIGVSGKETCPTSYCHWKSFIQESFINRSAIFIIKKSMKKLWR